MPPSPEEEVGAADPVHEPDPVCCPDAPYECLDDHHGPTVPAVLLRLVGTHGGRQLIGTRHPVKVPVY